jgi:hypothetical protein
LLNAEDDADAALVGLLGSMPGDEEANNARTRRGQMQATARNRRALEESLAGRLYSPFRLRLLGAAGVVMVLSTAFEQWNGMVVSYFGFFDGNRNDR